MGNYFTNRLAGQHLFDPGFLQLLHHVVIVDRKNLVDQFCTLAS